MTFARVVRENLRTTDIFGRVGGDEFAILLPNVSLDLTRQIVERIQANFASVTHLLEGGRSLSVTASFGAVIAVESSPDLGELLEAADEGLYRAKGAGRYMQCQRMLLIKRTPMPLPGTWTWIRMFGHL